jgi:hypothetical protein
MNSIAPLPSLHLVFEPIDQRTSPNLTSTKMLFTAPARRAQPLTNLARHLHNLLLSARWLAPSPSRLGGGNLQE